MGTPANSGAPTYAELVAELRRLKTRNERLERLVEQQQPTRAQLLPIATAMRDLAFLFDVKAAEFAELRDAAYALIGDDYLPRISELGGILSEAKQRVDALLEIPQSNPAVDPAAEETTS